jgi:hypothetical protein
MIGDGPVATPVPTADSDCIEAGLAPPAHTRPCNRVPCPDAAILWAPGPWGPCDPVPGSAGARGLPRAPTSAGACGLHIAWALRLVLGRVTRVRSGSTGVQGVLFAPPPPEAPPYSYSL